MTKKYGVGILIIFGFIFAGFLTLNTQTPEILSTYITFENEDTSTSATINYYIRGESKLSQIYFDTIPQSGHIENYRFNKMGTSNYLNKVNRTVNSVLLEDLTPNTTYYFVAGDDSIGYTKEFKFRTLPNDDTPVTIVQGGDMGTDERIVEIADSFNAAHDAHAILIGGDIAYANGENKNITKWDSWFEKLNRSMISKNGFLIPLILAIGNHEVRMKDLSFKVPFFFNLFPQNGKKAYFMRRLGNHSILFVLDSGHADTHVGNQLKWIKKVFAENDDIPNKLAMYHIPLYPSHRSYAGWGSSVGRQSWGPIFDKHNLSLAFENHDHTMKRSKMLRDNKIVPNDGVIYVGDGCWGKNSRAAEKRWYLEKSMELTHAWVTELSTQKIRARAYGIKNEIYDDFSLITRDGNELID